MLAWRVCVPALRSCCHSRTWRVFSAATFQLDKPLPPRRKIDDSEITESFLKGSGPGGQKINKTSSAVQLKHLATGIVVKCQGTRSRDQNRKDARRLLGERLDELEKGGESRTAIKTGIASAKKASAKKKSLRKYKKLAEEKVANEDSGLDGSVENSGRSSTSVEGETSSMKNK